MAVWIYTYGKNELLDQQKDILDLLNQIELDEIEILGSVREITKNKDSTEKYYAENRQMIEDRHRAQTDEEYAAYLSSINFPFIERDKLVDHFISEGLEREKKEKQLFQSTYEQFKKGSIKSDWEKVENGYINTLCNFNRGDGLSVILFNDLIRISGPFEVFSDYTRFQKGISNQSREYYHSLFIQICETFKSDFILYSHEWAGLDDEEEVSDFDFKKLMEQSDWQNTSSSSIHTMQDIYFEQI
ncbi:MAG: hypothetical protein IIA45_05030 [Bacteroidetes bacterium]|nr:hypothetical protein [Bacteroidota bacterium]